ncbi:MAG: bifunctional oligoribonuclease/PAP phosphatase NrnA [Roseburia sp.]
MDPKQLIEILKGHKTYIQTHNFPDPDAIASAFGLQFFLKQHGIRADICYDGRIEKLSTKKMFSVFGIDILSKDEISDMLEEDYIVTVDSQKYNSNLTDFIGDEVACIDHHPTVFACEYAYKDVRMVGACATLIAEYFCRTQTEMSPEVASCLAYGIKMDTADFMRGATALDAEMFSYVFQRAKPEFLSEMYANVMEFSDLKAYGAAIDNIHVYGEVGFAAIPFDCPDALIAIISDFILSLDVVNFSVVYAIRSDGIKFSVRSARTGVDAGIVVAKALQGYGSGGGHPFMAGGFIPREHVDGLSQKVDYMIEQLFLNEIAKAEMQHQGV